MQKEILLKILAIELLIIAFVKYQVMGTEDFKEEKKLSEEEKDKLVPPQEEKKVAADLYEVISKGKDFMGSVKPYLNKRDQYYVDMFAKVAEIIEIQKNLMSLSEEEIETEEKTEVDKIGLLKAIKPYITEDKQVVIDKFLKFHEALKNLQEKMQKYSKEEDKKENIFDKIVDIYEAIRPIIPEDKIEETDKLAKNIKLLEVLNKAEGIMNSTREDKKQNQLPARKDKEEQGEEEETEIKEHKEENKEEKDSLTQDLPDQQLAIIDNLKFMLTKEQQQYMYNMINYLKQQGLVKSEGKKEEKKEGE
ncbi:MAG TPA: hypothetical protein GXX15_07065 [Clostridia bacterium]|nr:hypothetical protein [Clostridia bacterium]